MTVTEMYDDGPGTEHNLAARQRIIQECGDEMQRIIDARQKLNEEAGGIRERLRDNGIDVKSFQVALKLVSMEDAQARDNYIDGLKEAYNALPRGGQIDWVDQQANA